MLKKEIQMTITLSLGVAFSIIGMFNPLVLIPSALFISIYAWLVFFNAHNTAKEVTDLLQLRKQVDDLNGQVAAISMMVGGRR